MDNTKNLRVVFTGDSAPLTASFKEVQAGAEATGKSVETAQNRLGSFGTAASALGRTMSTFVTAPMVGIGIAAYKLASDFQQNMEMIHTQAGASQEEVNKLTVAIHDMVQQGSYFDDNALAQGLYHLESLGLRGADAMNALGVASKMAAMGNANLEDTTSALGAALVTGIEGTQNLSQAAGILDAIIGQGNMRMEDLVSALGSGVLPVAKNAGLSLRDVGAALATLTDNGMGAEESATRLRMTFALMEAPSQKAAEQLSAIGMTSTQMALDMRTKGLIPALTDLRDHLVKTYGTTEEGKTRMAAALTEIFGGGRSSAAAQTLINELDRMQTKFNQIGDQSNEFAQRVGASQQTVAYQAHVAWNKIKDDLTQFGQQYGPAATKVFNDVANAISKVTHWLDGLSEGQKQAILWFGLIVAAIGPVLLIFGTLSKAITSMIALVGLIGPAFSGAAAISTGAIAGVRTAFLGLSALLAVPMVMPAIAVGAAIAALGLVIAKAWETKSVVENMRAAVNANVASINATTDQMYYNIVNNVSGSMQQLYRLQQANGYSGSNKVYNDHGTLTVGFASGGFTGFGGENEVAGIVHKGEYVLPKNMVDQTTGMPKAQSGGGEIHLHIEGGTYIGTGGVQQAAEVLWREFQRIARANGFNGVVPNIGVMPT